MRWWAWTRMPSRLAGECVRVCMCVCVCVCVCACACVRVACASLHSTRICSVSENLILPKKIPAIEYTCVYAQGSLVDP